MKFEIHYTDPSGVVWGTSLGDPIEAENMMQAILLFWQMWPITGRGWFPTKFVVEEVK